MFDKVVEIIAEKLGVEASSITLDTSFSEDLQADSLDMVELVMCLEDEVGLKVEDDKLETIKTVKDVVEFLESK